MARVVGLALVATIVPFVGQTGIASAAGTRGDVNSWAPSGGTNVASSATATAHSSQAEWPASMLVDGNPGTSTLNLWSAVDTGTAATGWVNLELAADAEVGSVVLFPRADAGLYGAYFPAKYKVTLLDAQGVEVWTKQVDHPNSASLASVVVTNPDVVDVTPAVIARTVRIDVIERHAREGGVLQLAEVAVFAKNPIRDYYLEGTENLGTKAVVTTESSRQNSNAGWARGYLKDELIDKVRGWTSYSLPQVTDPRQPTWVQYDLGAMANLERLVVFPHHKSFPRDYRLQISRNAVDWTDVAHSVDNPDVVTEPQWVDLDTLPARYVRLMVEERNTVTLDPIYGYQVQLAEFAVLGNLWTLPDYAPTGTFNLAPDALATYSSSYERPGETWAASLAQDEVVGTTGGWTTNPYDKAVDPATAAWLAFDLGCEANVERLVVFPRQRSFPRDYRLQVSADGTTWDTVVTSTDNVGTVTAPQMFDIEPGVTTRHVRLHVDYRNAPTGVDGYLAQLSEIAVFGTQSCVLQKKPALRMQTGAVEASWLSLRGDVGEVTYKTSDAEVATVDAAGRITAAGEGTATVTAENFDTTVSIDVEVRKNLDRIGSDILVAGFWAPSPDYVNQEQFAIAADFGLDMLMGNDEHPTLGENLEMAMLADRNGFTYMPMKPDMGCAPIPTADKMKTILDNFRHVPGVGGLLICDEAMPATDYATAFNTTVEHAPELYPHYNFCPWGACGVDEASTKAWLDATGGVRDDWNAPDYLMYDMYPLKDSIGFSSWFANLEHVRKLGLEYKIKTATYLQSIGYGAVTPSRRPTTPEVVWEVNTSLAYGYKQLAYFTYWQPTNRGEVFTEAIMRADGTKSDWFEPLKELNSEIHALGPTLMKLDATNLYFNGVANGQKPVPATMAPPKADGTLPANTFFVKADGSQNLLLSHMVDRETKEHYLFVVNNSFTGTNPVATSATLTFDAKIRGLHEVSRVDGTQSEVALADNSLSVNLAGAEGRLFKLTVLNTGALEQAISGVDALTATEYTVSSWNAVTEAVAAAEEVRQESYSGGSDQTSVNAATAALQDAIDSLAKRGDPRALEAMIGAADILVGKAEAFTAASVEALEDALAAAGATYDARVDRTQAELDAASASLRTALDGLEVKSEAPDVTVLQALHSSSKALSNTDGRYTASSWSKLQAEIKDAEVVLNGTATQPQIDQAVGELSAALAGLEQVPPKVSMVTKVKLNQSQLRLVKGASFKLEEGVYYDDVHAAYSGRVTWKTSNSKVATVSSSGKIKAKKTGTVTITATSTQVNAAGKKLSTSIKVTVVKKKPKSKVTKVSASVPKTLRLGQVAYITGSYSSSKATGVRVTYGTTKADVVVVDKVGRLVAKTRGTDYITVKAGGRTARYKITVK